MRARGMGGGMKDAAGLFEYPPPSPSERRVPRHSCPLFPQEYGSGGPGRLGFDQSLVTAGIERVAGKQRLAALQRQVRVGYLAE